MAWKYKTALKSFLWGIAGFFVSTAIITQGKSSFLYYIFGYPLYVLSLLMFVLAFWQLYGDNKKK